MAQDRKNGNSDKSMTAVEWLQIKMATSPTQEMVENINVWFKEAKQMEKGQIIETFKAGNHTEMRGGKVIGIISEQYYNETFGKV